MEQAFQQPIEQNTAPPVEPAAKQPRQKIFSKDDPVDNVVLVIGVLFVIFQIITAGFNIMPPTQMVVVHGLLCLVMTFLVQANKPNARKKDADGNLLPAEPGRKLKFRFVPLIMLLLSLVSLGFIIIEYQNLIATKAQLTMLEIVMGIILVVVFWEATRETCGWTIPILAALFVAYVLWGQYLPQPFWHTKIGLPHIVAFSGIGLAGGGVFGTSLTLNANCVFLFMIFGTILTITKADDFFMEVAKIPGRYLAGGPAMTAVASSCLVGMVTGSGQANVAITGTFTIPLMKRIGYTPAMAGGIESAASTGGSIMPPVMGIVAFVMAQYTGTPYVELIKMAIMPALMYYICIALYVHFQAKKLRIEVKETEKIDWKKALMAAPLFIVPVIVLIALLGSGKSLRTTVFFTVLSLIALGIVRMIIDKVQGNDMSKTLYIWLHGLKKGAIIGAEIGVTMGIVGAMVSCMDLTGLLIKFPGIIAQLANGNLFIMLLLTAIVTILLGCGLPPFASYLLVAMLTSSALINAGLEMMQAHFFIYMFATFALITPPVGLANVVAAPIAGVGYLKVSWEAVRAGCVAWILPIMIIGTPAVILMPLSGPADWVPKLIACFFLLVMLQVTLVGYFLKDTVVWQRVLMGAGAVAIVCYIAGGGLLFALGIVPLVLIFILQIIERNKEKRGGLTATA